MTQRSKGYEVLRCYVRFAFWLTHKRIVVSGLENIPENKPLIFAANHQNALMDPLALVCTNSLQTLWLARADIFRSKLARPVLNFMKMLPIYRIRDGKDNLSNNEAVFSQVTNVLEDKQSVALFPEAAHSGKRQMLPHKKAIPRIALDAEEKNNFQLGLLIVPAGIYYDHYWQFNRTLIIHYGAPIEIDSYKVPYAQNPQNAMLALRDEIRERLVPLTMEINSVSYYADYEFIRQIAGFEYTKSLNSGNISVLQQFRSEQDLMARVGKLENKDPQKFNQLISSVREYVNEIKNASVTEKQVVKASRKSLTGLLFEFLLAVVSLPLFIFGFIFNAVPFFVPRVFFAGKVKDHAFLSTFNFAFGLVLFPLFYLLEGLLVYLFSGSMPASLCVLVLMPFAGKYAFQLKLFYTDLLQSLKLKLFRPVSFRKLLRVRQEFISLLFGAIM